MRESDRFVFAFDSLISTFAARSAVPFCRYGHRATHGYLFKQLIYNRRKYATRPPPGDRGALRQNANNYASVLIAVIKCTVCACVGAHKSHADGITYNLGERPSKRPTYENRGRSATIGTCRPEQLSCVPTIIIEGTFAWGEKGSWEREREKDRSFPGVDEPRGTWRESFDDTFMFLFF